jgi:hypothetical protein
MTNDETLAVLREVTQAVRDLALIVAWVPSANTRAARAVADDATLLLQLIEKRT